MAWKYDEVFEQPQEGYVQQQLITYRIKDGKMLKTTVTRKFYRGDYQDSTATEVLTA